MVKSYAEHVRSLGSVLSMCNLSLDCFSKSDKRLFCRNANILVVEQSSFKDEWVMLSYSTCPRVHQVHADT